MSLPKSSGRRGSSSSGEVPPRGEGPGLGARGVARELQRLSRRPSPVQTSGISVESGNPLTASDEGESQTSVELWPEEKVEFGALPTEFISPKETSGVNFATRFRPTKVRRGRSTSIIQPTGLQQPLLRPGDRKNDEEPSTPSRVSSFGVTIGEDEEDDAVAPTKESTPYPIFASSLVFIISLGVALYVIYAHNSPEDSPALALAKGHRSNKLLLALGAALVASGSVVFALMLEFWRAGARTAILSTFSHAPSRFPRLLAVLECKLSGFLFTWSIAFAIFWDEVKPDLPSGMEKEAAMVETLSLIALTLVVDAALIFLKSAALSIYKHRSLSRAVDDKTINALMSHVIFSLLVGKGGSSKTYMRSLPVPPQKIIEMYRKHTDQRTFRKPLDNSEKNMLGSAMKFLQMGYLPSFSSEHGTRRWITSASAALEVATQTFLQLIEVERESREDATALTKDSLLRAMDDEEGLVSFLFDFFDKDSIGVITGTGWCSGMLRLYRDCKGLSLTLQDTRTIARLIDNLGLGVLSVAIIGTNLLLWGVSIENVVVPLTSFVVGFSFIFGNVLRTYCDSIAFLLAMHPFDTGDTIMVANVQYTVQQMFVLSTVLKQCDGQVVIIPNGHLMGLPITNCRRSDPVFEATKIMIDIATPVSRLVSLQGDLADFVQSHHKDWKNELVFQIHELFSQTNCMELHVRVFPKTNWHYGDRFTRLHHFHIALMGFLKKYEIRFVAPAQPLLVRDGLSLSSSGNSNRHKYNTSLPSPLTEPPPPQAGAHPHPFSAFLQKEDDHSKRS